MKNYTRAYVYYAYDAHIHIYIVMTAVPTYIVFAKLHVEREARIFENLYTYIAA